MNNEQLEALYGPSASHAEHRQGDTVQFRVGSDIKVGKILHVRAPAPSPVSGQEMPTIYVVDAGEGIPLLATPSQIVQGSFTAVLGTYGYTDSQLQDREQAEAMVENLNIRCDYCMDSDKGHLCVLKARVEGDEEQGRIIAECEAVSSEESH